jgi:ethanolamine utilization protein EutN
VEIARVIGSAVATAKSDGLTGGKLLVAQPLNTAMEDDGRPLVAYDDVGAGVGEVVLVASGSAARIPLGEVPVDATIVAILDRVDVEGAAAYVKT